MTEPTIYEQLARHDEARDRIVIIGGGTLSHVRSHLALAAPAFGSTARKLAQICDTEFMTAKVELALTKMANAVNDQYFPSDIDSNRLVTNEDIRRYVVDTLLPDPRVKIIFFSAAMCDFDGEAVQEGEPEVGIVAGKYARRLSSSKPATMQLTPAYKIISLIHLMRPDIFVVGFKTTAGEGREAQIKKAQRLLGSGCNLVLANDIVTRNGLMVHKYGISPDYSDREVLLVRLVSLVRDLVYADVDDINTEPSPDKRWKSSDDYSLPRKTPKEGLNKV